MRERAGVLIVVLALLAGACGTDKKAKPAGIPVETGPAAAVLPVVTLQENLEELNLYTGAIDGSFSPAVEASLRVFQSQAGLPATGALDAATSPALAAKLGTEDERPVAALQAALTDLGLYAGEFSSVYDKPTADGSGPCNARLTSSLPPVRLDPEPRPPWSRSTAGR